MKVAIAAALIGAVLGLASASAQDGYPSRLLQFTVPFTAGSSPDVMTRIITDALSKDLGQPIFVENRAGAGGNIAAEYAARQPGHGHSVFVGTTGNMAVAKSLLSKLSYDPETAFSPVSIGWMTWNILIVPSTSQLRSVQDVITEARRSAGAKHHVVSEPAPRFALAGGD